MKLPQNGGKASIISRPDTIYGGLGGFDLVLQPINEPLTQDVNQHA
jgi:hypothetical protein